MSAGMQRPPFIAPSILSADFCALRDELRDLERAGADYVHVDVMDGHFVPNVTIGPPVVAALRKATSLPLDCHLMMTHPDSFLEDFARAGADIITVHAEAVVHLQRTLAKIRAMKVRAGVALNPHTPEDVLRYVLNDVDLILVMSVNPGFGGQSFLPAALDKIKRISALIEQDHSNILLEVDGGISTENAEAVVRAGARVLVAGAAILGQPDRVKAATAIREAGARGLVPR
jgi:ribulose-phosphate 3-epimerase